MVMIGAGRPALAHLEPADSEALRRLFLRLSPQARYRRFLSPVARPEQVDLERLLNVDHRNREAVCGVVGTEVVGVAEYARRPRTSRADVAVVVEDAWQRQGLATRMLAALDAAAARAGIDRFEVMTLAENRPALALLHRLRPGARLSLQEGVYETSVLVGRNE